MLTYVRRHSLPPATVRQLFEHVRFPFLSNDKLAALMQVGLEMPHVHVRDAEPRSIAVLTS